MIRITGDLLNFEDVWAFLEGVPVCLDEVTQNKVKQNRADLERHAQNHPVYGVSRGFGQHQNIEVSAEKQRLLQMNLITSHAISFGDPASPELTRLALLFRFNALAKGYSGVRLSLLEHIQAVLNTPTVAPYVPLVGSLGASGDLSPLSHIALFLLGQGSAYIQIEGQWEKRSSVEALARCGLTPFELASKEGLALNNGMQFSTAHLLLLTHHLKQRVELATLLAGCLNEAMLSFQSPFDPRIHALRPHQGQGRVAVMLYTLFEESNILKAHPPEIDNHVQEPYTSRCLPQIIGPFFDAVDWVEELIRVEMNSATDNPLVFEDRVVSGGNFHGMNIALASAHIFNCYCAVVKVLQSLLTRVVDKDKNRLGLSCLIDPRADQSVSSGMMIAEYSAHALGNLILSRNSTAFLHSVSSASGQEDHVSHAPTVLNNLESTLPLFDQFLAILACLATRSYEILATEELRSRYEKEKKIVPGSSMKPGKIGRVLLEEMEGYFPLEEMIDDQFYQERMIQVKEDLIETGRLHQNLMQVIGPSF
jgi:histidine ammonia-lyase